jgi:hypothetical protein
MPSSIALSSTGSATERQRGVVSGNTAIVPPGRTTRAASCGTREWIAYMAHERRGDQRVEACRAKLEAVYVANGKHDSGFRSFLRGEAPGGVDQKPTLIHSQDDSRITRASR